MFDLNDYVVARTLLAPERPRVVAHSRQPPQGYVEAFRPNLIVTPSKVSPMRPRSEPLEDDTIRSIERFFRESLPEDRNTPQSERSP